MSISFCLTSGIIIGVYLDRNIIFTKVKDTIDNIVILKKIENKQIYDNY